MFKNIDCPMDSMAYLLEHQDWHVPSWVDLRLAVHVVRVVDDDVDDGIVE